MFSVCGGEWDGWRELGLFRGDVTDAASDGLVSRTFCYWPTAELGYQADLSAFLA